MTLSSLTLHKKIDNIHAAQALTMSSTCFDLQNYPDIFTLLLNFKKKIQGISKYICISRVPSRPASVSSDS